nr:hypothetical protein Itr_chr13CG16100 [Ipomoea trifida]GLL44889.1 hypothetical protein Itr_chr13CG16110 [Ipomoea trifida]
MPLSWSCCVEAATPESSHRRTRERKRENVEAAGPRCLHSPLSRMSWEAAGMGCRTEVSHGRASSAGIYCCRCHKEHVGGEIRGYFCFAVRRCNEEGAVEQRTKIGDEDAVAACEERGVHQPLLPAASSPDVLAVVSRYPFRLRAVASGENRPVAAGRWPAGRRSRC